MSNNLHPILEIELDNLDLASAVLDKGKGKAIEEDTDIGNGKGKAVERDEVKQDEVKQDEVKQDEVKPVKPVKQAQTILGLENIDAINASAPPSRHRAHPSNADSMETVRHHEPDHDEDEITAAPRDWDPPRFFHGRRVTEHPERTHHRASSRNTLGDFSRMDSEGPKGVDILGMVLANGRFHPMNGYSWLKKWAFCMFYCFLQTYVTLSTTSYLSAMDAIHEQYGGYTQVIIMGQSLFLVGNAVGPAVLGPLSDVIGRRFVYAGSIAIFAALNLGCAYAVNLPMLIIFMFLCGIAGSSATTNVAGTIADMFGDIDGAGQAMAMFVISANAGPSIGAPLGDWISNNPEMGLKWVWLVNTIIGAGFAVACCFMEETLPRLCIARGTRKLEEAGESKRKRSGFETHVLNTNIRLFPEMAYMTITTFRLVVREPIIWVLAFYNGCTYGLLFLYFAGVHEVFVINNGLTPIEANLTYLNFLAGVILMFCYLPIQSWLYGRDRQITGRGRPEARFLSCLVFVWLFPISLIWFALTSEGNVLYWSPIMAGTVLAFVDPLLWLAMLNYITDAYPHVTASAIAAFFIPSFLVASLFAHIGRVLFDSMGAKAAMMLVGLISVSIVVLVYVIYFRGAHYRGISKTTRRL